MAFKRWCLCLIWASSLNGWAQVDAVLDDDDNLNKPLWEIGALAAGFRTPTYPAAKDSQSNIIATPYVVYRGEVFRIGDGSAARAVAIDEDWIEVDLSLDGAFNADSDENSVRAGMPDLDYVFEIGPQITLRLARYSFDDDSRGKLIFKLQTRAAFSTDFSGIDHRGYVIHPELSYQQTGLLQEQDRLSFNLSPIWATEKLHDYFYQVDTQFETEQREAFDARSGYLGSNFSVGYLFDVNQDIRVFMGASFNFHQNAQNRASPLFFDKNTLSFGAGIVWRFFESDARAGSRLTP